MAPLKRRPRGLTLSELLISVGLLAVVILTIVGVFIGGLKLMNNSKVRTGASNIARQVLEAIEDEGGFVALPDEESLFDGAVPTPAVEGFPPAPYPVAQADGRDFTVVVETRNLGARARAVLVTVNWDDRSLKLEKVFHAAR